MSVTDICNLALVRARVAEIGDFNENSAEAAKCRVLWEPALRYLLAKHNWRFATTTKALALTTNTGPLEWGYEYGYPSDCIRPQYVLPPDLGQSALHGVGFDFDPIPFTIGVSSDGQGRTILTNLPDAYLSYTRYVDNLDILGDLFKQAFAWYLASDLALAFGGDSGANVRQTALGEYRMLLSEAEAQDANSAKQPTRRMPKSLQPYGAGVPSHYHYDGGFYRRY